MGQSITLSHLAPFVDVSREKIRKQVTEEFERDGIEASEDQIEAFVENQVRKEVASGVQTIQYQVITIMTTNG